jgi:hypothetical protein
VLVCALVLCQASHLGAHDAERTEATLTFAADGSFVLDVANDPDWLLLRLEPFAAESGIAGASLTPRAVTSTAERDARLASFAPSFIDRVVLWIDGREVRPTSAEYVSSAELRLKPEPTYSNATAPLGIYRLRGRVATSVRSLRWFYGIVIDPYPLRVQRADGRTRTETILGQAWSETIDLSGQFDRPSVLQIMRPFLAHGFAHVLPPRLTHALFIVALLLISFRPRPLLLQLGAFSAAHAAGLLVATFDLISPPLTILNGLLVLAIVYAVSEALIARRPSPWRVALIAAFGMAFGLESGMTLDRLAPSPSILGIATVACGFGAAAGHLTVAAVSGACVLGFERLGSGYRRARREKIVISPESRSQSKAPSGAF